ncbi:MAG: hypothetical protein ACM3SX_23275 [Deltaproteobacteria bacterium]
MMKILSIFGRLASREWTRASQLLGVVLIVAGILVVSGRAQAQDSYPLDQYPGLGRSSAAVLRDNTIAAWEAYRREAFVASCLGRAGFSYRPAVEFPSQALAAVADGLGVTRDSAISSDNPAEWNANYAAHLATYDQERYYRALVGESASDMKSLAHTGQIPPGASENFAQGGCRGAANAAIGSVWTLKWNLAEEFDGVRRDIAASPQIAAAMNAFNDCAQRTSGISAHGPADIDALAASGAGDPAGLAAVVKTCTGIWTEGYRSAQAVVLAQFERRNIGVLQADQARYQGVMQDIAADSEFTAYLAHYAWMQ